MIAWLRKLDQAFFAPLPVERIAALRVIVGLFAVYHFAVQVGALPRQAAANASEWTPMGAAVLFSAAPAPALLQAGSAVAVGLAALFALGLATALVGPLLLASSLMLLSMRSSWGVLYHNDNLLFLTLLVLVIAPSSAAWSLDAALARRWPDRAITRLLRWPWGDGTAGLGAGWPLRLLWALMSITYFLAGLAKVAGPAGWGWASGMVLRDQIGKDAITRDLLASEGALPIVALVYQHHALLTVPAIGTLVLELGAPLFMLHRNSRRALAFGLLGMHWGIYALMGIIFPYQLSGVAFLCLLAPETWVPRRWR